MSEENFMFRKILVASDFLSPSDGLLDAAIALAKTYQSQVMLCHVISAAEEGMPNLVLPFPESAVMDPLLHEQALQAYVKSLAEQETLGLERLQTLASEARQAGVEVEFSQNHGDPGRVICNLAGSWGADLIVVGRRGHRGLAEWVLGSVSNYVMHHAPCSVLTVQGGAKGTAG